MMVVLLAGVWVWHRDGVWPVVMGLIHAQQPVHIALFGEQSAHAHLPQPPPAAGFVASLGDASSSTYFNVTSPVPTNGLPRDLPPLPPVRPVCHCHEHLLPLRIPQSAFPTPTLHSHPPYCASILAASAPAGFKEVGGGGWLP